MQGGIVLKKQSNLSRLLSYAGGHKYFTYVSWILSAVCALTALVPFWYIWKIINEVLKASPNFGSAQNLTHYGIMAMAYAIISYLIYIGALLCSHLAAFRIAANMRIDITDNFAKLPSVFTDCFARVTPPKFIHDSTAATETYLAHQLPDKYAAMATPVGLLALLLVFDWRLGLLSLVPVAVGFAVMSAMTGKRMEEKMRQYGNALAAMSNEAVEYVRGIPVVKTFGQSVFSFKKFKATIDEYKKWVLAYTKDMRLPMMLYTAAINGVFAFLILGAFWFTNGTVTSEFFVNLLFYIIITPVISVTLTKIMYMSEEGMVISDAIERIDSVLNAEPMSVGNNSHKPKSASVELESVHFSYDGKKEVISDISLKIKCGQTVAFVGPSGGGKSTLASLISRFFDVNSGSIKIGGVDVRDIPKDELMNTVSFVFQNSKLIKASILDNVKMGKSNATDEEVLNALRAAQCMDIIEKFPDGVNTVIGSRGVYLSGGEMQRIAIARAVLKNAPIIILDEATAFADPDNEVKVQKAFAKLSEGKTVIMIAHRLSTVRNVDCIYVISDGKIVEYGNRAELIEKKGMFYKMQNDYQSSVGWKVSNETEESRND